MNTTSRLFVTALTAGLILAGCAQDGVQSGDAPQQLAAPVLEIVEPFTPQPAVSDIAAAYFTVINTGDGADALISASTDIAERVEVHESVVTDGLAEMRPVEEIVVPAGDQAVLERGGYHLMLINPQPLAEGDTYDLTVTFDQSGDLTVEVPVTAAVGGMNMDDMDDGATNVTGPPDQASEQ